MRALTFLCDLDSFECLVCAAVTSILLSQVLSWVPTVNDEDSEGRDLLKAGGQLVLGMESWRQIN